MVTTTYNQVLPLSDISGRPKKSDAPRDYLETTLETVYGQFLHIEREIEVI